MRRIRRWIWRCLSHPLQYVYSAEGILLKGCYRHSCGWLSDFLCFAAYITLEDDLVLHMRVDQVLQAVRGCQRDVIFNLFLSRYGEILIPTIIHPQHGNRYHCSTLKVTTEFFRDVELVLEPQLFGSCLQCIAYPRSQKFVQLFHYSRQRCLLSALRIDRGP